MILAELFIRNILLFAREVGCFQDSLAQPLVAAGSREHTAHQMIAAVCVRKGMKRIVRVDAKFVGRNEDRPGRTEREIAPACADRTRADRRRSVVACTGHDLDRFQKAKCLCRLFCQRADDLEAFKQLRHLAFRNAANLQHFLRPALVLHVEQQHTGSVGIIAGVNAGELVRQIVLREHDLRDFFEIFRLVFAHPKELRRRKARKSDVCRQL